MSTTYEPPVFECAKGCGCKMVGFDRNPPRADCACDCHGPYRFVHSLPVPADA